MGGKQPGKARGARSKANLLGVQGKAGPGRPKRSVEEKAAEKEAQKIARKLLDPAYQRNLRRRLLDGKAQPGVEVAIWQYAFGKPRESVDTPKPVAIRLVHEYTE